VTRGRPSEASRFRFSSLDRACAVIAARRFQHAELLDKADAAGGGGGGGAAGGTAGRRWRW